MPTIRWTGNGQAVAQRQEVGINVLDLTTTYGITIGGVTISVAAVTNEAATITALAAALNASSHPYFKYITWSKQGSTFPVLRAISDVAGMPHVFTTSAVGGTGSWEAITITVANAGPNDINDPNNWSSLSVPTTSDIIVFENNSQNVCWGLDQNSITWAQLIMKSSYIGRIGLRSDVFAISADGSSTTTIQEYREDYLKVKITLTDIGETTSTNNIGSGRIKINNTLSTGSPVINILKTGTASSDSGYPAIRLLTNNANLILNVSSAVAGIGIAFERETETSLLATINNNASDAQTKIWTGSGATITTINSVYGDLHIDAAATITTIKIQAGNLYLQGNYVVTSLYNYGAVINADISIGTVYQYNGTIDLTLTSSAKTITLLKLEGGLLYYDPNYKTITTIQYGGKVKVQR